MYTEIEKLQWAAFDKYCVSQLEVATLRSARNAANADITVERANARCWTGYLRTTYNYVFTHTGMNVP